jgi:hypothetical protein
MRAVAGLGRWVWGVSGVATVAVVAISGAHFINTAGVPTQAFPQPANLTRTVTVRQPVTSLTVDSYGGSVQVTGANVSHVRVSETFGGFGPDGGTPSVSVPVSDGQLTVGSPACDSWENCVAFVVVVPRDVTVTVQSQGGPVTVSGVAGVNLDSGSASMNLSDINGPVKVTTDGGPLQLAGVTGPVQADTGGGSLSAIGITAATATVTTDGGPAQLAGGIGRLYVETGGGSADVNLSTAPDTVTIDSDGGPAALAVPGGPYAVTADTDGGPQTMVTVPTSPTAARTITVSSGGGSLQIEP